MSTTYRMTLPPVTLETAEPRARQILEETKKQIRSIPNMYAFMANAPGLLETYRYGYQRFREGSGFTPAEQEVVFLAISVENGCEYCVAAHSAIADASRVPRAVTDAVRDRAEIPDSKLRPLAALARSVVVTRGRPSPGDVQAFLDAGYSERQVLDLVLAVAVKTISNYTNHLFDTPVDASFKAREWKAA
jgi:uncharacterized peroxidase-related enzyme